MSQTWSWAKRSEQRWNQADWAHKAQAAWPHPASTTTNWWEKARPSCVGVHHTANPGRSGEWFYFGNTYRRGTHTRAEEETNDLRQRWWASWRVLHGAPALQEQPMLRTKTLQALAHMSRTRAWPSRPDPRPLQRSPASECRDNTSEELRKLLDQRLLPMWDWYRSHAPRPEPVPLQQEHSTEVPFSWRAQYGDHRGRSPDFSRRSAVRMYRSCNVATATNVEYPPCNTTNAERTSCFGTTVALFEQSYPAFEAHRGVVSAVVPSFSRGPPLPSDGVPLNRYTRCAHTATSWLVPVRHCQVRALPLTHSCEGGSECCRITRECPLRGIWPHPNVWRCLSSRILLYRNWTEALFEQSYPAFRWGRTLSAWVWRCLW